jgi:hypothetical protein
MHVRYTPHVAHPWDTPHAWDTSHVFHGRIKRKIIINNKLPFRNFDKYYKIRKKLTSQKQKLMLYQSSILVIAASHSYAQGDRSGARPIKGRAPGAQLKFKGREVFF